MANKKIRDVLNDGFIQYGTKETERSPKGKRIGEKFVPMGKLAYQEMSCRDEDYEMAKVLSAVLSLKIRTLCPPQLRKFSKNKLKVVVDGTEYDVIKADSDREKMYLYFYLQEVGTHEQDQKQDAGTD
ncbi:phage head-tail adapter protein [Lysinibacillus capsici]|uniref:phage head-tail adapter protein n=1 Tax=Lysinibacillus capsici TaxID=2115968 RepID=UPI002E203408|nr:phage head-tail adapter protein [Lysinibacillus capsici]